MRSGLALPLLLLGLCACGAGAVNAPPSGAPALSQASIWFHPLPAISPYPGGPPGTPGATDFDSLFTGNTWPRATARTSVFGMYAGWVSSGVSGAGNQASDQELQSIVTFVNAHNMTIELEAPALQATATCGAGIEGYVPYGQTVHDLTLAYLQRLKALAAPVQFIKVDEAYFYGTVSNEAQVCHFTVTQIAQALQSYTQLVQTVYPNAQVGDVEPVVNAYATDPVTAIGQWHDAYKAVTGAPFPFFIADMDFSNAAWPTLAKSMETATRGRGMKYGIIYSGDPTDTSDTQWIGKTVARFQAYQGTGGGRPDYVLFQSWNQHPWHALPETDATTFTGALDAYVAQF
jgi:hypothetical protein